MTEEQKPGGEPSEEQELGVEQLEQVNGGILIGLNQPSAVKLNKALPAVQGSMGDGSVLPVIQEFSPNK